MHRPAVQTLTTILRQLPGDVVEPLGVAGASLCSHGM
ncbi:MAG: hydrogen peroxide-inducible genes activator, partial [Cutibacterium acnes]|nr:hydrogen peroxide-inducible genes activator [Cutibacterium acnes]